MVCLLHPRHIRPQRSKLLVVSEALLRYSRSESLVLVPVNSSCGGIVAKILVGQVEDIPEDTSNNEKRPR